MEVVFTEHELNTIIFNNVLKMLKKRELINDKIYNEYVKKIKEHPDINHYNIKTLTNKNINIKYINDTVITLTQPFSNLGKMVKETNENNLMILIHKGINPKPLKEIGIYKFVELFEDYELKIDLMEHVLVPEMRLLNETQKKDLLSYHDITHFPKIRKTDPAVRYFNAKTDDIIMIIRTSKGQSIDFRRVM